MISFAKRKIDTMDSSRKYPTFDPNVFDISCSRSSIYSPNMVGEKEQPHIASIMLLTLSYMKDLAQTK